MGTTDPVGPTTRTNKRRPRISVTIAKSMSVVRNSSSRDGYDRISCVHITISQKVVSRFVGGGTDGDDSVRIDEKPELFLWRYRRTRRCPNTRAHQSQSYPRIALYVTRSEERSARPKISERTQPPTHAHPHAEG